MLAVDAPSRTQVRAPAAAIAAAIAAHTPRAARTPIAAKNTTSATTIAIAAAPRPGELSLPPAAAALAAAIATTIAISDRLGIGIGIALLGIHEHGGVLAGAARTRLLVGGQPVRVRRARGLRHDDAVPMHLARSPDLRGVRGGVLRGGLRDVHRLLTRIGDRVRDRASRSTSAKALAWWFNEYRHFSKEVIDDSEKCSHL